MDLHLQPDWHRALGQRVEIWRDGEFFRNGTVEAVMPDQSILWISAEGATSRQMIFRKEGCQVFAHFLPAPESVNFY
ncbi:MULTISPECIES: hypothetical protein [Paenarthrobacter]|uniref:Uncharacterized protein n=1 Tax=Paenarthrobacter aromaticivorans TaxID=2849150 RepID=A0ABS6IA16_9MICC|nr:hypothetical protein [Paenarthrobacter sp. MMS21-TAE1-1]MBU8868560.1 hypothetical protein [Paenarthrobacter sp. MMS21-TAE1-1]